MSRNLMSVIVSTRLVVDMDAWATEYGIDGDAARDDVLHDVNDWARQVHFTEPKWDGLIVNARKQVTVHEVRS